MPRLRMYRRSWQLTLGDMATLLGFKSAAHVSRLEQGKRTPSLETALACTAIFGVALDEIFPELMYATGRRIEMRATRFRIGHEKRSTPVDKRKCDLMDEVIARVGGVPKTIEA